MGNTVHVPPDLLAAGASYVSILSGPIVRKSAFAQHTLFFYFNTSMTIRSVIYYKTMRRAREQLDHTQLRPHPGPPENTNDMMYLRIYLIVTYGVLYCF